MIGSRSPWKEVGVFDRDSRTYHVEKIPKPPEGRAIVQPDPFGRETLIGHEMQAACPKCFERMIFRWHMAYSDRIVEEFADGDNPDIMSVAVAKEMHEVATQANREKLAARERAERAEISLERVQAKLAKKNRHQESKRRKRQAKQRRAAK